MDTKQLVCLSDGDKINVVFEINDISMVIVPESIIVMKSGHTVHCECQEVVSEIANKMWQRYNKGLETHSYSGKPEPVSFDIYKDQWVKAKLTYKSGRLRAINEGEVYMIRPYMSRMNEKYVAVRNCLLQGERIYSWKDVQFELVDSEGGSHE